MTGTNNIPSYIQVFCLYSTYLDTLFCNLTFLQTFFSSLDAYLRLRNPTFYLASSRRRPALWLKIGSPWFVASLQAVGQLSLSDRHQIGLHANSDSVVGLQTTCLLPDANFLIIRTAIAYALPLLACIVLVGLQLHRLRQLRVYSVEMLTALVDVRLNKTSSCTTTKQTSQNPYDYNMGSHSGLELTKVRQPTYETLIPGSETDFHQSRLVLPLSFTYFSIDETGQVKKEGPPTVHECPRHGTVSVALHNLPCASSSDARDSWSQHRFNDTCVTRDDPLDTSHGQLNKPIQKSHSDHQLVINQADVRPGMIQGQLPLWLDAYNGEQLAVAINLVSCIIALGTWSPYILSTLAHGLCSPAKFRLQGSIPGRRCLIQVTPDRIADFRWWAYASSGLLLPCLLFFLDLGLREGCLKAICRAKDRQMKSNLDALELTCKQQTYRCNGSRDVVSAQPVDRTGSTDCTTTAVTIEPNELWSRKTSLIVDDEAVRNANLSI